MVVLSVSRHETKVTFDEKLQQHCHGVCYRRHSMT
jgi:hypothetical protein